MVGKTLGHYELREPLGAGGMGEVYLAEDSRLGRTVAIKVLQSQFASDLRRLARFEQEARAAATLNHPHIAVVYDVGAEGDTHFIVQEHLSGQTLRQRLEAGSLPLSESLELAIEVAEALGAAHGAGIVHRDLKPDNIFVTEENHAKVLDFGLAKLIERPSSGVDQASDSPTVPATAAGQILGTAGYMAPEQVSAGDVDHRADFFAFGCVLYEMSTGKRAFAGKNLVETMYHIGEKEPVPLGIENDTLPRDLDRIVGKCLAKAPRARYQSAADLVVDLRSLANEVATGTALTVGAATAAMSDEGGRRSAEAGQAVSPRSPLWRTVAWAGAAGLVGFVLGALIMSMGPDQPAEPAAVSRFELGLPAGFALGRGLAFSADGQTLVFAGTDSDGTAGLFRRPLGEFAPIFIVGSEGGTVPRFSPDGESLVFRAGERLFRISVNGGSPLELARGSPGMSASWGPDGAIYYGDRGSIYRIDPASLQATLILPASQDETYETPIALDDEGNLLLEMITAEGRGIGLFDAVTGVVKELISDASSPDYIPAGFITYRRGNALLAEPFDANRLETSANPFALEAVSGTAGGIAQAAIAADGTVAYVPRVLDATRSLVWLGGSGVSGPLPGTGAVDIIHPRLSPDGTTVAAAITFEDGSRRVATYRLGHDARYLALGPVGDRDAQRPVWDPTAARLFFAAVNATTGYDIYRAPLDQAGIPEPVLELPHHQQPADISPDGRYLLFDDWRGRTVEEGIGISYLAIDDGEVTPFVSEAGIADQATFHPDGDLVAFRWDRDQNGQWEVYVASFPVADRFVIVSTSGGNMPVWAPDGSSLFYALESGAVMMAPLLPDAGLEFGPPRQALIGGIPFPTRRGTSYDVAADGRFIVSDKWINPSTDRIFMVLGGLAQARLSSPVPGQ